MARSEKGLQRASKMRSKRFCILAGVGVGAGSMVTILLVIRGFGWLLGWMGRVGVDDWLFGAEHATIPGVHNVWLMYAVFVAVWIGAKVTRRCVAARGGQ